MKYWHYILFLVIATASCEDVIDVEVPSETPRLAIDAFIRIDASVANTTVQIKADLTSSFFSGSTPADLTSISIINPDYVPTSATDQNVLNFSEVSPGVYEGTKSTTFFTGSKLQLLIEHDGQRYRALTRYVPSAPIERLEQGDETLFSGNETEVIVAFTDNVATDDFYLFDFDFEQYLVTEDEFYQGGTFQFSYFYDDVNTDQLAEISLMGVEEGFYNYMNQLIVQAGGDQGPFQTPAATVRGNIINVTEMDNSDSFDNPKNSDNFALGYFAVSQEYKETIIFE